MSRSNYPYNSEDWETRKATLIRCLFHDVPMLSPVDEFSNESRTNKPTQDVQPPQDEDDKPESPLPPLIIEKVPNRHDEPEEYYDELLIKIKTIYRKLFIKDKDLSIEDLNSNSLDSSSADYYENDAPDNLNPDLNIQHPELGNESFDSSYENDTRESSNSIYSDGYSACTESSPSTEELIHVENYSKSYEDVHMREEEETENTNNFRISDPSTEEFIDVVNYTKSDGDDHMREEETENTNNLTKSEFTSETIEAEESSHLNNDEEATSASEESNNARIEDEVSNKSIEFSIQIMKNPEINEEYNKIEIYQEMNEKLNTNNIEIYNIEMRGELTALDSEKELISAEVEAIEEGTTNASSDGPEYMQITTKAIVHVDGRSDVEKESRIYEDSVKSLILPRTELRRVMKPRYAVHDDRVEELSELEDNEEPDTKFNPAESEHSLEPLEIMRTPQPKMSHDSIPITARNESNITGELEQPDNTELASLSSSRQGDDNDLTQPKTSDEMNNILNSIFNESLNKDADGHIRRKRKLNEDVSVQTSQRVTWDELKAIFFVGTPKIFRLCACKEHICN